MRSLCVISLLLLATATLSAPAEASAQAVSVSISPLAPYGESASGKGARGGDSSAVALYAMAFLGSPGMVQGVDLEDRQGFHFASVNLLFSAGALPTPDAKEYNVLGNLHRLHARVTLIPLDSMRQPLTDRAALEVLAALPDTMLVAAPTTDSSSSRSGVAAVHALTRSMMPALAAGEAAGRRVGPVLVSFLQLHHRPSAALQVGYTSDPRTFGWVWYGKEQIIIEGTHHASAAVELGPAARYIQVRITLTGEWRSHHASWQREVDVILSTTSGP
jgi:hypothetical protein